MPALKTRPIEPFVELYPVDLPSNNIREDFAAMRAYMEGQITQSFLIPASIYHEPITEPEAETTTAELRTLIGYLCAKRLRFDAEGKFRES